MADHGRRKIIEDHPKIEGHMFEAMAREQQRKSSPDIDISTCVEPGVESYDKMETYRELAETIDCSAVWIFA